MGLVVERTLNVGAKKVKTLALVGSLASKYNTRITNCFDSGKNNIDKNVSNTNNTGKILDATTRFLSNMKNRFNR